MKQLLTVLELELAFPVQLKHLGTKLNKTGVC